MPPFPALERPLHLALPCVGLDGVSHGLVALNMPFQVDYAFFKLGPHEGDILQVDVRSWDRVDAIVAGPPCQPDSNIGLRMHAADPRSAVLEKVTGILVDQGHKGAFFFIMEFVPGAFANHRKKSPNPAAELGESHYMAWLRDLRPRAPMFNLMAWKLNTAMYLPQNRVRHAVCVHQLPLIAASAYVRLRRAHQHRHFGWSTCWLPS